MRRLQDGERGDHRRVGGGRSAAQEEAELRADLAAGTEERARDAAEPIVGVGSLPRKEDARFIRGRGTYLDDIRRPGMLHGAILGSPLAHARFLSIDASAALAPHAHRTLYTLVTGLPEHRIRMV